MFFLPIFVQICHFYCSFLSLYVSLCGRSSAVVPKLGSAQLSISSSLHLRAAAEPGPHHPACQSPLYTFNPSYPSLCKAASHTAPLSPPPFKTAPPSTEALRSSFNSLTSTHSPAHKNTSTPTMWYRYGGTHTHTTLTPSLWTLPFLLFIPQHNSIIQPPSNKPFTKPSAVNL